MGTPEPEDIEQETKVPDKTELETGQSNKDDHDSVEPIVTEPGENKLEIGSGEIQSVGNNDEKIKTDTDEKEAEKSETIDLGGTGRVTSQLIETDVESNGSENRVEASGSEEYQKLFSPETTEELVVLLLQLQLGHRQNSTNLTETERDDAHEETEQTCESGIIHPLTKGPEISQPPNNEKSSESDKNEQRTKKSEPIRSEIVEPSDPESRKVPPEPTENNTVIESETVVCNFIWRPKKSESIASKSEANDLERSGKNTIESGTVVCNFIWRARKLQISDPEKLGTEGAKSTQDKKDSGQSYKADPTTNESDELGQKQLNKPEFQESGFNGLEVKTGKPEQIVNGSTEPEASRELKQNIESDESEEISVLVKHGRKNSESTEQEESRKSEKCLQATDNLEQELDEVQGNESEKVDSAETTIEPEQTDKDTIETEMITVEDTQSEMSYFEKTKLQSSQPARPGSVKLGTEGAEEDYCHESEQDYSKEATAKPETDESEEDYSKETKSGMSDFEKSEIWETEEESSQSNERKIEESGANDKGKAKPPMIGLSPLQPLLANAPSRLDLEHSDRGTEKLKSTEDQASGPGTIYLRIRDFEELKEVANKPEAAEQEAEEMEASRSRRRRKKKNKKKRNLEMTLPEQGESWEGSQGTKEQVKSELEPSESEQIHSESLELDWREEGTITEGDTREYDRVDAIKPGTFEEEADNLGASKPKRHKKKKKRNIPNTEESEFKPVEPESHELERIEEDTMTQMEGSRSKRHRKKKHKKMRHLELTLPEQEESSKISDGEKKQVMNEPEQSGSEPVQQESHEFETKDDDATTGSDTDEYENIDMEICERARKYYKSKQNEHAKRTLLQIQTYVAKIDFMYCHNQNVGNLPAFLPDVKSDRRCYLEIENSTMLATTMDSAGALYACNDAIALAEEPAMISVCHAVRSKALYNLGLHRECIEECNKALSEPWPAEGPFRQLLENRLEKASLLIPPEPRTYHEEVPHIPPKNKNPHMQSVSDLIRLKNNKEFGRHYIAKKDIDIGQVLVVEDPYVLELDSSHRTLHCDHCLELCYVPIPCDTCASALYCGDACKIEAFESYHRYECPIRKTIDRIWYPCTKRKSLRAVFKARREIFFGEVPHVKDTGYRSDRFKEVDQLYGRLEDFDVETQFEMCSMVSIMYHFVKHYTDFFEEHDEDTFKEVLLHVCSIMPNNSREIDELRVHKLSSSYGYYDFATGMFPSLGLFNHSCAPNTTSIFYGKTIVLYSIQTIKKGQQCFISYVRSCHYPDKSRDVRQQELRVQFGFQCKCIACENDWPTMDEVQVRPENMSHLKHLDLEMVYKIATETLSVPSARKELRPYINHLRKAERNMPSVAHSHLTVVVNMLLRVLGNKNFALRDRTVDLDL